VKIVSTTTIAGDTPDEVEIAMIELAHKMAMSTNPAIAARGRFMKATGPAFIRWMVQERDRIFQGSDPDKAATALLDGYAQAVAQDITTLHNNLTPVPDIQNIGMLSQAELILCYVQEAAAIVSKGEMLKTSAPATEGAA
jgi:hypothetical protein